VPVRSHSGRTAPVRLRDRKNGPQPLVFPPLPEKPTEKNFATSGWHMPTSPLMLPAFSSLYEADACRLSIQRRHESFFGSETGLAGFGSA